MAEKQEQEDSKNESKPSFIEVVCKSSGKVRRFAPGTDAAFAVSLINKKLLLDGVSSRPQLASHIEAVKPGNDSEEPISFGPTAPLVNYGPPWVLHTVDSEGSRSAETESKLPLLYIAKIVLALLIVFAIGTILMLFLENLPALLLYIQYNM
ncbi:hypothetical protein DCAR_0417544 [Daucus carota subsp. sativus]|uniref:Uncharacterized protein n=1 Tax=Daucus carota subsp. sativus TaxID=79200 RepID=A0AAF1AWQ1_DAUCS|nr:hypothetical protein DCAR_0417544 [Daucus carota subsp. sativus]